MIIIRLLALTSHQFQPSTMIPNRLRQLFKAFGAGLAASRHHQSCARVRSGEMTATNNDARSVCMMCEESRGQFQFQLQIALFLCCSWSIQRQQPAPAVGRYPAATAVTQILPTKLCVSLILVYGYLLDRQVTVLFRGQLRVCEKRSGKLGRKLVARDGKSYSVGTINYPTNEITYRRQKRVGFPCIIRNIYMEYCISISLRNNLSHGLGLTRLDRIDPTRVPTDSTDLYCL